MNRFARDFWGCFLTVIGLFCLGGAFASDHRWTFAALYCLSIYWACKILHLPTR